MTEKTIPQLSYGGAVNPLSLVVVAPLISGGSETDPTENTYGDAVCNFAKDLPGGDGGGGGGATWWFTPPKSTTNTGNFAALGIIVTPQLDCTLDAVTAFMTTVGGGIYRVGVAPYDTGVDQMTSAPSYSTPISPSHVGADHSVIGSFSGGFAMTGGASYLVFVNRTDDGDAPSTTIDNFGTGGSFIYPNFVVNTASIQGRELAKANPSTSDVWSVGGATYLFWLAYTVP